MHNSIGKSDTILIEEKLVPGLWFDIFCQYGLADIRVIVFNLVPIIAMLRIPTKESEGKANLAQGGIGLGVDITTGKISTLYRKWKSYTDKFPSEFAHFEKQRISYWKEILEYSADTQFFVNSWYLWMDRVVTANGPKLLEINARAGLQIQNITGIPLLHHMQKIEDLHITSPIKWLEISKSLFGKEKITESRPKNIIHLSQAGRLVYIRDNKNRALPVTIEVWIQNDKNYASDKVIKKLLWANKITIDLWDESFIRPREEIKFEGDSSLQWNKVQLGRKLLENYYIIPKKKSLVNTKIIQKEMLDKDESIALKLLDDKIASINSWLALNRLLRPTNYLIEFDKFVEKQGKYDPQFIYNFPLYSTLQELEKEFQILDTKYRQRWYFHSPIAQLFFEKIDEWYQKIQLIKAYKQQNSDNIRKYNTLLFGEFDDELINNAETALKNHTFDKNLLWKPCNISEIKEMCKAHSNKLWIPCIITVEPILSRMSIVLWQNNLTIRINSSWIIKQHELQWILAHELDTHARRFLNGKKTWRNVLQSGTAHYLTTEEWLAVYNAEQAIQKEISEYKNINIHGKYLLSSHSQDLSFQKSFEYIHSMEGYYKSTWNYKSLFNKILKQKRGLKDTSQPWWFFKDKVYLQGYEQIKSLSDEKRDQLMVWKIKVEDLQYFS